MIKNLLFKNVNFLKLINLLKKIVSSSENIKELTKRQFEDKTNEVTEEIRKLNI